MLDNDVERSDDEEVDRPPTENSLASDTKEVTVRCNNREMNNEKFDIDLF